MDELRVGVIGAGALGRLHMETLTSIPTARLVRVCDPQISPPTAAWLSAAGATVVDLAAALDPEAVDAVVVATPTDTHADIAAQAISAGISVFCEKPLARTVVEAQRIVDLAHEHGVKVAVGHVVRYFPEYAAARDLVLAGELGTVSCARLARLNAPPAGVQPWYSDADRSGGVLLDMAIHDIDWCLWTFGPAARVYAVRAGRGNREVVAVTLRHESGVLSYLDASWRNETFSTRLELWGAEGFLHTDGSSSAGFALARTETAGAGYLPASSTAADDPFRLELQHAITWFSGGDAPLATAADGLEAVRVVDGAERSIRTQRPIGLGVEVQ